MEYSKVLGSCALNAVHVTLGQRIRQARKEAGLTQLELAKALGVGQAWISKLEADDVDDPGVKVLMALAKVVGVTLSDLAYEPHQYEGLDTERVVGFIDRQHRKQVVAAKNLADRIATGVADQNEKLPDPQLQPPTALILPKRQRIGRNQRPTDELALLAASQALREIRQVAQQLERDAIPPDDGRTGRERFEDAERLALEVPDLAASVRALSALVQQLRDAMPDFQGDAAKPASTHRIAKTKIVGGKAR